ncbi:MAG: Nif3-like dinuclear metal center hexameric protein [Clostridia bacterium]|nr:Nif3-like dinuclear metal center hexameric protein [Clostridia bacterium]
MLLNDFIAAMESIAPRELALDFDNPGLIVGTKRKDIRRVLAALDCTVPVVREAAALKCDLVLTHHPLLFHAVKHIDPADPVTAPVFELIENGIGMFAAHTNLDSAEGGVNTTLCRLLGIINEEPVPPENLCRAGELEREMSFLEFASLVESVLHTKVRVSGHERPVKRIMVCGGSGGSEYPLAAKIGADVLVTGECRHSEAVEAECAGVNLIVAGHYETEAIVLPELVKRLKAVTDGVEYIFSRTEKPLRTL